MSEPKRIAIMQPTYFPWLGYFAMMDRVSEFIFLDSVQFAARSWQQRNRIKTANGELMLTVPVSKKGKREQLISEVEIAYSSDFPDKHVKAVTMAYRRAPYFDKYAPDIFAVLEKKHLRLADMTIELIKHVQGLLGIQCRVLRSSELDVAGNKAELLAQICDSRGAQVYLSAPGSRDYIIESDAFSRRRIDVVYHEYLHPVYKQLYGEFAPYMAVVDVLMNEGPASADIIRGGITAPPTVRG